MMDFSRSSAGDNGFKKLFARYRNIDRNDVSSSFFKDIPKGKRQFQLEISVLINESIDEKDGDKLSFCLGIAYRDGIDDSYTSLISRLLPETWHDEHEHLVNTIWLNNLKDDILTDSLYAIAIKQNTYRKYDDELESTLRKCIHALKMINSEKAKSYIELLKETENSNVTSALEVYAG